MLSRLRSQQIPSGAVLLFSRRNSTLSNRSFFRHFTLGVLVGTTGGLALVGTAGYGIYHYSGLKRAVDTFTPAALLLKKTKEQLATEKIPTRALNYLRQAVKAYVAYIPGAGFLVDRAFDSAEEVVGPRADEANAIIAKAYEDVFLVVQTGRNEHRPSSVVQILSICRQLVKDLTALGARAGAPIAERLELEKRMQEIGSSADALVQGAKSKLPEVQQSVEKLGEKVGECVDMGHNTVLDNHATRPGVS
ncbi:hypothetical protein NLJ89_g41 [Agrocybe chaxingu]|uniref:Uncharacterized protein n=1 Tax=Agrocybe chaxingu TaxID=84603 RepID=A0A9W8TFM8_9AGAR|nr:hypothetical protein NLJ89_g41 [Agrocybe chaxingu]